MSSRYAEHGGPPTGRSGLRLGAAGLAAGALVAGVLGARPPVLRVCADPNNLPFSNRAQAGFENRLAQLVARELHRTVEYTWWPQRRGFVRQTLDAGRCDLVMGMPSTDDRILTTRPYYAST